MQTKGKTQAAYVQCVIWSFTEQLWIFKISTLMDNAKKVDHCHWDSNISIRKILVIKSHQLLFKLSVFHFKRFQTTPDFLTSPLRFQECQDAKRATSISHQFLRSSFFSCCCLCFWAHASWCGGPGDQIWRSCAHTLCSETIWLRCVSWCDGSVRRIGRSAIHTLENDMYRVFHLQRKYHKFKKNQHKY